MSVAAEASCRERQRERGIRIGVLEQQRALDGDRDVRQPLRGNFRAGFLLDRGEGCRQSRQRGIVERFLDGLLTHGDGVGKADAIGREHSREGMDEGPLHAQRVGDQAGVLTRGAAEAGQRVLGDIMAALHRDLLDGIGHVLDRDANAAGGEHRRVLAARCAPESSSRRP